MAKKIKRYKNWENSEYVSLSDFLKPMDEIDEEFYFHYADIVPAQYLSHNYYQMGEAQTEKDGVYFYHTFGNFNEKFYYLGIMPEFMQ